jgi:hypothetical protein
VKLDSALDIDAVDHAMRNWTAGDPSPIAIGTEQHLILFCRMLLETHNPYKPAVMNWPKLGAAALARLISLPIWDIAVQTEGRASIRVQTFAEKIKHPLLRQALELDGAEEARHKAVLSELVRSYDIPLVPEPPYPPPKDAEMAWLITGYSECIDSFFAFGLFALAKRSGYFPAELVETFEPVIQEEARHILFFANWVAWHRKSLVWWRRLWFELRVVGVWIFLIYERIGITRGMEANGTAQNANFAVTGSEAIDVDVTSRDLITLCLEENERRMSGYDRRLARPTTIPALSRIALRLLPRSKPQRVVEIGSEAHKTLFCRQFIDSYSEFAPETLPWPVLTAVELERLRTVPFWQEVRHTERRAGAIVAAFTETIDDPLLRDAIALQGLEETRHARLLAVMIERYGIDAPELPLDSVDGDVEKRFIDFGFGECLDSFLGFGAFKFARQSGFLPEAMFDIFDRLMFEETRHIVFFINWMAWREARLGRQARPLRHANSMRFYGRAIGRLLGTVRRGKKENHGKNFSATQASMFLDGFNFRRFVEECYSENARRMSLFDPTLLQPRFLPRLADAALAGLRLWDSLTGNKVRV